jgi:hypothetical protein
MLGSVGICEWATVGGGDNAMDSNEIWKNGASSAVGVLTRPDPDPARPTSGMQRVRITRGSRPHHPHVMPASCPWARGTGTATRGFLLPFWVGSFGSIRRMTIFVTVFLSPNKVFVFNSFVCNSLPSDNYCPQQSGKSDNFCPTESV